MAVGFDVASESHTGTTGSASEASFTWNHGGGASARGALVFVFGVVTNALPPVTSVTYGGVTMTEVPYSAIDTDTEPGSVKAFYLDNCGTGTKAVVVNRTNNTHVMYAVCFTVTAATLTEVYNDGVKTRAGSAAEKPAANSSSTGVSSNAGLSSVDDGSPGTNSLRFMGRYQGTSNVTAAGTGSTAGPSIDFGLYVIDTFRETTAGQGARNVGGANVSDDLAWIALAVREKPNTYTRTADAIILRPSETLTITANAIVGRSSGTKTFTANAWLAGAVSSSFAANAVIKRSQAGSCTASAILRQESTGSFSAAAVIKRTRVSVIAEHIVLDQAVNQVFTRSAEYPVPDPNMAVRVIGSGNHYQGYGGYNGKWFLGAPQGEPSWGPDWYQRPYFPEGTVGTTVYFDINNNPGNAWNTGGWSYQSSLIWQFDILPDWDNPVHVDVYVQWYPVGTTPDDPVGAPCALTAGAVMRKTQAGSFTADAVIRKTASGFFAAAAVILKPSGTLTFTAASLILRVQSGSLSANAVIKATMPGSASADAIRKRTFYFGSGPDPR